MLAFCSYVCQSDPVQSSMSHRSLLKKLKNQVRNIQKPNSFLTDTTMICLYQLLLAARWCLVYWPKDEAVSVVRECDVISPRKEELSKGVSVL